MSESSKRGKRLEQEVAKILRSKLGATVHRDKRSGAGGTTKTDIKDWYQQTPFDIECKDHATIKVKEWMRQAIDAASYTRIATLVFRADENILACVKFDDLVNLAVEIQQLRAENEELRRQPLPDVLGRTSVHQPLDARGVTMGDGLSLGKAVSREVERGAKTCRNGHIADDYGFCLQVDCKYSRGYRPPKGKRNAGQSE